MQEEAEIRLPRMATTQRADVTISRAAGLEPETAIDIFRGAVGYNARAMAPALREIGNQIEASRYMLALGDDWDNEGAPGYQLETWERASAFINDAVAGFVRLAGNTPPVPRISHGPDGSIDILWASGDRELLINIPADGNQAGDFYGDTRGDRAATVKGTFSGTSPKAWLLIWLTS